MSYTMKQQSLNQKSTKRRCPLIGCLCFFPFLLIGLVLLAIGALFYDQFDDFFNENVQKQMIISDQSNWWYSKWLKPEIEETLNIYIFEVINTKALRKNWLDPIASKSNPIKPHVRQIGPFVFRVQRTKENVEFVDPAKKQISYIERVRYYFDEFASSNQLDHSVRVVNSELMALNPFIRLIIKRAQAVARISGRLRSTIDEMINIYIDNVFIDRPVWRLIFGPLFKSEFESNNETSDEMNDLFDDNSLEKEFSMNEEQMKNIETLFSQTSLSSSNQTELIAKYNDLLKKSQPKNFSKQLKQSSNDREEAINKILKLFDQVEPFFKKLGVDINPYELLIGSYRFENQNGQIWLVKSNQSSQQNFEKDSLRKDFLENLTDRNSFKENSVFRFFTNNSKSKYKITTGLENRTTAQILEWNDSDRLNSWYGDNCNRIKGTDGHQYHTFLSRQNVYFFEPKLCRSIPMTFDEMMSDDDHFGIEARRYRKSKSMLQSPIRNKKNRCYCRFQSQPKRCNYDGILDLANCYHGAPLVLTNPHFSETITKSIAKSIDGLEPNDQDYQTIIDVEPISGVVLQKIERFQFNVHLLPISIRLNSSIFLPESIIPLFWFEENWSTSKELRDFVQMFFIYPTEYRKYGIISIFLIGLMMIIIAFCCLIKGCGKKILKNTVQQNNGTDLLHRKSINLSIPSRNVLNPIQFENFSVPNQITNDRGGNDGYTIIPVQYRVIDRKHPQIEPKIIELVSDDVGIQNEYSYFNDKFIPSSTTTTTTTTISSGRGIIDESIPSIEAISKDNFTDSGNLYLSKSMMNEK